MKAVVAAFNQEKALVGAFSVIAQLPINRFAALMIILLMMMILQASEKWDMPSFKDRFWMQLGGYVFVITGMFLYSDVIIMPYIRQRRADKKISQDAS